MLSNTLLIVLLAMSGALIFKRLGITDRLRGINNVDVHEAKELINTRDAVVLDVREADEFVAARIPSARHIPLREIGGRINELKPYKDKPIVVSCRSGSRSAHAVRMLHKQGFTEVYNLKGGLVAWVRANLALES